MAEDILEAERLRAAYLDFWKRAIDAKGISTRYEFWVPMIGNAVVLSILTPLIGHLGLIASLAVAVPTVTVSLRRLNDLGRPWTHIFFALIPVVGTILFLYWMAQPGKALPDAHSKLRVDPEIEPELAAARAELDAAMGTGAEDADAEKAAEGHAADELDALLGSAEAARREQEDREATEAAARDLDTMFSNDVDDDPLAREIAKAAQNGK